MAQVVYIDPIEHLSGKLGKKSKTVYCFRKASGRKYTNIQGIRSTQVTADELALRQKFRICTDAARTRMDDATHQAADQQAFRAQHKYTTMLGWLVAQAYSNYDENTHTVIWS
jgi:hypothetical protein